MIGHAYSYSVYNNCCNTAILITPVPRHAKAKQGTGFKRFGISTGEAC